MSQENVEIVRRFIDHANATGELPLDLVDAGVELVPDPMGPFGGTYRGHEGVRRWFSELTELDAIESRLEVDELIDAGDAVVLIARRRVRARYSDTTGGVLTTELPFGAVSRLREGRLVHVRIYLRPAEALEAAGVSD
jgi:ketosteroid isomerase-like protein